MGISSDPKVATMVVFGAVFLAISRGISQDFLMEFNAMKEVDRYAFSKYYFRADFSVRFLGQKKVYRFATQDCSVAIDSLPA